MSAILLAAALAASPPEIAASGPGSGPAVFERFGAYIVVEDVDKSAAFYERILGKQPQLKTKAMVGFDIAGGLFALVSRADYAPDVKRGDSAIPYIKVASVEALFDHVKKVAPTSLQSEKVKVEGPFRFFKVRDPDGNIVEFFSVSQVVR
ncbi:VOC family protein [Sphingomonas sp.]|uniref:VOC family protein n=1 Tax=Sphingomonas sp. TaxID=28214 RepID=UPI00286C8C40|nr:VOC family protein [Sphingomonas sp.]